MTIAKRVNLLIAGAAIGVMLVVGRGIHRADRI